MLHHICAYMFEGKDADFDEQNLNVIWSDLKDIQSCKIFHCTGRQRVIRKLSANPLILRKQTDKLHAVANATYEISVVSYTYGAKGAHNVERTILP